MKKCVILLMFKEIMESGNEDDDDKCPICLVHPLINPSKPSGCRHVFCRQCLVTWAAQKSECPLCKADFRAILSGPNFTQKEQIKVPEVPDWLRQLEREASEEQIDALWPRIWHDDDPVERQRQMEELRQRHRAQSRQRLRAREARHAGTTMQMIRVRRAIYRENRAYHSQSNKQTRDARVEFYQANPACTHRLIPWVRRELVVLFGCQEMEHINRLMGDIIRATTDYGITSQRFREMLQRLNFRDYIGPFIENYQAFASSIYNTVDAWDKHAVYRRRRKTPSAPFRPNITEPPTPRVTPSTPPPQRSLNQPNTSTAIILSSDEELGPNECTPPRPTNHAPRAPPGPNQASSSRYYYHDRVTADGPLGDANPILNPITANRPGPSSSQRAQKESERRRSSVYSRIYDEASNSGPSPRPGTARYAQRPIPTINFDDVQETARKQVRHISRLEMVARQRAVMTISSDDDDDEVDNQPVNPEVPSTAFRGQMVNRTDSIITLDHDSESDNDCVVINQTSNRPGSSGQVCLISTDDDITDSEFECANTAQSRTPLNKGTLQHVHRGGVKRKRKSKSNEDTHKRSVKLKK